MRIKVGDLVYIKQHSGMTIRHNNEIWLVLDTENRGNGLYKGFIRIQNIHNGNRVQYSKSMLMKINTDKI
jgi:translation elongation factor P/translation initiation factor 5A